MKLFKDIVLGIHRGVHKICCQYEPSAVSRPGNSSCCCCRAEAQHNFPTKVIFFLAIFAPVYVCIISSLIRALLGSKQKE